MSRSSPEAPRGSPSHRVLHAVHQKHPAKRFQEDLQSSPRDFGKLSIDALRMPSSSFCSSNVGMEELASMDVAHINTGRARAGWQAQAGHAQGAGRVVQAGRRQGAGRAQNAGLKLGNILKHGASSSRSQVLHAFFRLVLLVHPMLLHNHPLAPTQAETAYYNNMSSRAARQKQPIASSTKQRGQ